MVVRFSHTMGEEHTLRMFKHGVVREIFAPDTSKRRPVNTE